VKQEYVGDAGIDLECRMRLGGEKKDYLLVRSLSFIFCAILLSWCKFSTAVIRLFKLVSASQFQLTPLGWSLYSSMSFMLQVAVLHVRLADDADSVEDLQSFALPRTTGGGNNTPWARDYLVIHRHHDRN
jgi:hypothetical protein